MEEKESFAKSVKLIKPRIADQQLSRGWKHNDLETHVIKRCRKIMIIMEIMDKLYYKSILTKNPKLSVVKMGLADEFTFQQDNDPKDTSAIVKDYSRQKEMKALDWLSQ